MQTLPLTRGKFAIVDDADYAKVKDLKWYALPAYRGGQELWYAAREHNYTTEYLHRRIMNAPKNLKVDHINGNGLDCRRSNMRLCTNKSNLRNKRGHANRKLSYKGIGKTKNASTYQAIVAGKYIGRYKTEIEAAKAYNRTAKKMFGKYANLNIIPEGEA